MSDETPEVAPVILAEFPKNQKETLRVSLTEYHGNKLLDIRTFYPSAHGLKPGKGISIQRTLITSLRKALQAAEKSIKTEEPPPKTRRRRTAKAPDSEAPV